MQQFLYWPGDLIKFIDGASPRRGALNRDVHEAALVVRRDFTSATEPAVMLKFLHTKTDEYHYYDLELHEWELSGTIEVQRAS